MADVTYKERLIDATISILKHFKSKQKVISLGDLKSMVLNENTLKTSLDIALSNAETKAFLAEFCGEVAQQKKSSSTSELLAFLDSQTDIFYFSNSTDEDFSKWKVHLKKSHSGKENDIQNSNFKNKGVESKIEKALIEIVKHHN